MTKVEIEIWLNKIHHMGLQSFTLLIIDQDRDRILIELIFCNIAWLNILPSWPHVHIKYRSLCQTHINYILNTIIDVFVLSREAFDSKLRLMILGTDKAWPLKPHFTSIFAWSYKLRFLTSVLRQSLLPVAAKIVLWKEMYR